MHSRRPENLSQSTKAIQLRNSRIKRANERRFNKPLRVFLEHKYPDIFTEYTNLYQMMNTTHPNRKKLVSTATFRHWMATNPPAVTSQDILTKVLRETFPTETGQNISTQQTGPDQNNQTKADQELPLLTNEDVENGLQQASPQEDESLRVQIDNIINELVMDEDLRNVLDQPDPTEDEGIELNPADEIYGDIIEFDYAQEVEPFDF